jgi:hypothetical protein
MIVKVCLFSLPELKKLFIGPYSHIGTTKQTAVTTSFVIAAVCCTNFHFGEKAKALRLQRITIY